MKILRMRGFPPKRFAAINLFGVLVCRPKEVITPSLVNHERIHTAQMLEMVVVPYYIWYVVEWVVRLFMRGNAYENLSFEREAYSNMYDFDYLKKRRHYAWLRYMRKARG
jgi:hypothetical protein